MVVLFVKRRAGLRVFVCEGGPVGRVTLPETWTDRGVPGFVGCRLTVEGLGALVDLVRAVSGGGSR